MDTWLIVLIVVVLVLVHLVLFWVLLQFELWREHWLVARAAVAA